MTFFLSLPVVNPTTAVNTRERASDMLTHSLLLSTLGEWSYSIPLHSHLETTLLLFREREMCFTVSPAHILLALLLPPSCSPCPAVLLYRALFSSVYSNTVISTLSCPGHSHHQQQKQHMHQPNSHPSTPTPQVELLVRCAQDVGTTDSDVYNSASRAGGPSTGNEIQVQHTATS